MISFAEEPSADQQPKEADVTAYINKRMRDFKKLQGLIQQNIEKEERQDLHHGILKDAAIMQKRREVYQKDPSQLFAGSDQANIR